MIQINVIECFSEKLILLVIDKVLIGLVFLLIALKISKILERYRTQLTYSKTFAERRIDAYSKLLCAILDHRNVKETYRKFLKKYFEEGDEPDLNEFEKLKNNFADSFINLNEVSKQNMLFISEQLLIKMRLFTDALSSKFGPELRAMYDAINNDLIYCLLSDVQQLILDEVEKKKF